MSSRRLHQYKCLLGLLQFVLKKVHLKKIFEEDQIKKIEYAKKRYHNMSEKDKNDAREYARDKYKNLSEEDKIKRIWKKQVS